MSYSLDTPSIQTLKAEARSLRGERDAAGTPLGQGAALEEIARRHGYRDWNTASAALPARVAIPVQVGQRVKGTYLSRPFTGLVILRRERRVCAEFTRAISVRTDASASSTAF